MTGEKREQIKKELWFTFFTENLYKNDFITLEEKREIEKNFLVS